MARKALTKIAKEAVKKGAKAKTKAKAAPKTKSAPTPLTRTPAAQRRTAQRKARADRSAKPKSAPTPLTRTPAAQKRRSQRAARTAAGSTNKAKGNIQAAKTIASPTARRRNARASKIPTAVKAAAIAPAAGLTALAVTSKRKPSAKASEGTFGEAFKFARSKGEGTKFTYKGKQYTAVTKDDLKKKGYDANELKQYMNRKGKARGPLNRLGQGVKKVLLGKDKKFGGDKGAIDFIRGRKKPVKKSGKPGSRKMANFKAGGAVMSNRGLGKAYMKSKR
jgi:hypothetical protein